MDKSFCFSSPGNLQMGFGCCRFDYQRWVLYICILYFSMCVLGLFWHIQNRSKDKKGTSGHPSDPGRKQTIGLLCFSEPMLQSACVVSGDSVHAVTLITALQKALHMVRRTHLCSVVQF